MTFTTPDMDILARALADKRASVTPTLCGCGCGEPVSDDPRYAHGKPLRDGCWAQCVKDSGGMAPDGEIDLNYPEED